MIFSMDKMIEDKMMGGRLRNGLVINDFAGAGVDKMIEDKMMDRTFETRKH